MSVTVREATAEDYPAIQRCHQELEQKLGCRMDLPDFADEAILQWLVVEQDGEILGGCYFEKTVEQCHFGLDPRATAAIQGVLPAVHASCWNAGVRSIFLCVPKEMDTAENIGRHVERSGFEKRDEMNFYTLAIRRGV